MVIKQSFDGLLTRTSTTVDSNPTDCASHERLANMLDTCRTREISSSSSYCVFGLHSYRSRDACLDHSPEQQLGCCLPLQQASACMQTASAFSNTQLSTPHHHLWPAPWDPAALQAITQTGSSAGSSSPAATTVHSTAYQQR